MRDAAYFLRKAAECRLLANGMANKDNPAIARLIAHAGEFEAQAVAAEEAEPLVRSFKGLKRRTPLRRYMPLRG